MLVRSVGHKFSQWVARPMLLRSCWSGRGRAIQGQRSSTRISRRMGPQGQRSLGPVICCTWPTHMGRWGSQRTDWRYSPRPRREWTKPVTVGGRRSQGARWSRPSIAPQPEALQRVRVRHRWLAVATALLKHVCVPPGLYVPVPRPGRWPLLLWLS